MKPKRVMWIYTNQWTGLLDVNSVQALTKMKYIKTILSEMTLKVFLFIDVWQAEKTHWVGKAFSTNICIVLRTTSFFELKLVIY